MQLYKITTKSHSTYFVLGISFLDVIKKVEIFILKEKETKSIFTHDLEGVPSLRVDLYTNQKEEIDKVKEVELIADSIIS